MKNTLMTVVLAAALAGAGAAAAQQRQTTQPTQGMNHQGMNHGTMQGMNHQGMDHGAMSMPMTPAQTKMHGGPAGAEYHANMMKMHQSMMRMSMDPDPTRSWAAGMIAHHQGAIDNSRTVLKHTQDAEARRLANKTIQENTKGIQELQSWLSRHGGRAAASR